MSLGWLSKQKSRHRPHKHWTVLRMITVFKSKSLFCVWTESRSHTCKLVDDWHSGNHGSRLLSHQGRNHSWLLLTKVLLVTGDIISSNSYFLNHHSLCCSLARHVERNRTDNNHILLLCVHDRITFMHLLHTFISWFWHMLCCLSYRN